MATVTFNSFGDVVCGPEAGEVFMVCMTYPGQTPLTFQVTVIETLRGEYDPIDGIMRPGQVLCEATTQDGVDGPLVTWQAPFYADRLLPLG